jgi:hypothetical protein
MGTINVLPIRIKSAESSNTIIGMICSFLLRCVMPAPVIKTCELCKTIPELYKYYGCMSPYLCIVKAFKDIPAIVAFRTFMEAAVIFNFLCMIPATLVSGVFSELSGYSSL